MKTLPISQADFDVLSKWASVSRTLNQSKSLLNSYLETLPSDSDLGQDIMFNLDELNVLEPILNRLGAAATDERIREVANTYPVERY